MIVDVAGAAAALQAADDILILTHRRPDGDTAGCAGALCRGLQQIGKRAYILENPEITRRYAPLIVPYYPPEDFVPAYAVAAACLTAGIDGGEINRELFETKSRPRFEMERIVFDTMEFHENGAIAVAVLWRRDIDHAGADMDDLDSIASLTRQIEGVQIGITLTEKPDGTVRVSPALVAIAQTRFTGPSRLSSAVT